MNCLIVRNDNYTLRQKALCPFHNRDGWLFLRSLFVIARSLRFLFLSPRNPLQGEPVLMVCFCALSGVCKVMFLFILDSSEAIYHAKNGFK